MYHHTTDVNLEGEGLYFMDLSLLLNQPSILLHKNMEELLLPLYSPFTMVVVHSKKRENKSKLKINELIHPTEKGKQTKLSLSQNRKSWYHL